MTDDIQISRRGVVVGAGVAAGALTIAACGGPDVTYKAVPASAASKSSPTVVETSSEAPETTIAPPPVQALAKTSDVPAGGAVVVDGVLLTQADGEFRGFSPVCTHRGCIVETFGGTIACPCHGSMFNLDGTVAAGPAGRPLSPVDIKVTGDSIVRA